MTKDRLYNPDKRGDDQRKSAQYGLYTTLLSILKMIAPIMPYITEEIYQLYYADKEYVRPKNFLEVGGHKVFRDEIFGHLRGVWQADHKYYKKHGMYDFEQKKTGMRIMNFFLLLACKIPSFRKKYYANIMKFPAKRYGQLMDKLAQQENFALN